MKSLGAFQHSAIMIDLDKAFHDRHGKNFARYYAEGCIHLPSSHFKCLIGAINKEVSIVKDIELCTFPSSQ